MSDTCHSCNQRANQQVDEPFSKELWMRERRHRHRIEDRREGRVPDAPHIEGQLEDGTRLHSYLDRDGWYQRFLPSVEHIDENTFRFGVDASELDEFLAKKLERLRGQHGEVEVTKQERVQPQEWVTHHYSRDARMWPRFGAKVALALGAYGLGEGWLSSNSAHGLRAVLSDKREWERVPAPALLPTSRQLTDDDLGRYFVRPEHVVAFVLTSHGPALYIILFGETLYAVPLGGDWTVKKQVAWLLDPIARTVEKATWDELVMRVAVRYGDSSSAA